MWGLRQADGHILTIGAIYAPYLSGNTTYATAAFNPDKEEWPVSICTWDFGKAQPNSSLTRCAKPGCR